MSRPSNRVHNFRRQAAGRANRQRRGPLTEAGREILRATALRNQPWTRSTGPRSAQGKRRSSLNGCHRQTGPISANIVRCDLAEVRRLIADLAELRLSVAAP
jgi:hypothetical protein